MFKKVRIVCLTLLLGAALSSTAFANSTGTTDTTDTTGTGISQNQTSDNNGTDWGWLGLIGFAGLFGLRGRGNNRNYDDNYRDDTNNFNREKARI